MVRRQTGDRPTRIAILAAALTAALTLPLPPARALAGTDGLIAVATTNGIEVFDSSVDGSDLHVLIANGPNLIAQDPAWSPRGNLIAYTAWTDQGRSVWVADADGTDAHQVSAPDEYAQFPAWSPDGRLSYLAHGIEIVDPDGTHRTEIVPAEQLGRPNVYTIWRPTWTADGRLVVLLVEPGEMAESPFIADGDGTHLRPLTFPGGTTPDLSDLSDNWQFSSTGLVAFVVFDPQEDYHWVHFATFDGTNIIEASDVTTDLGSREDVALSPSGQQAVVTWPGFPDPDTTGISLWDVDLTSSTDSLHGTGGFEVDGAVAGLDWQPRCSITGTSGDDELTGTAGPDLICGLGGNDVIHGLRGNDVIHAGGGSDVVLGGRGNDVVVGGKGADTIHGSRGRDLVNSRRDAYSPDTVDGGVGHDVCLHDRADVLVSC